VEEKNLTSQFIFLFGKQRNKKNRRESSFNSFSFTNRCQTWKNKIKIGFSMHNFITNMCPLLP
jgi:hypothetical protein